MKEEIDGPAINRHSEQRRSYGRRRDQGQRRYIIITNTDSKKKKKLDTIEKDYKIVSGVWGLRIATY